MKGTLFINAGFYQHENSRETIAETRRTRQHGKFSLQDYDKCILGMDNQEEFFLDYFETSGIVIEKYLIPAKFKPQLRIDLISEGYHGEFLYASEDPEINKVRDYCKKLLYDR